MTRYVRFGAFDRLSEEGKLVVLRGVEADWAQQRIQDELAKATGESISNGALGRFVQHWRTQAQQMDRLEKAADRVLRAAKQNDIEAEELGAAMIAQGLMAQQDEVGAMEPRDLLRLNRDMAKLAIERKKLELDAKKVEAVERQLALKEAQLEAQRQKAAAIAAEAERAEQMMAAGTAVSAETLRKIREQIYGLSEAA